MDLGLEGKRALVLSSTAGLGRAVAAGLAAERASVVVAGRDPERTSSAALAIGAKQGLTGDLSVEGEAVRLVSDAVEVLGGLDILVVNTGGGTPGGILDNTDQADIAAYQSMLRSALAAARAAAPALRASGAGRLLFITARSVLEATPELALSSVFRSGVAAAARSLALELAPEVLVNVVVPGQFDTGAYHRFEAWWARHQGLEPDEVRAENVDAIPVGRLGLPEELGDVVVFLCSARASYVTGSVIRVDGGGVRGF
jgi:3-oxoacyl-[acyl-carrier protein] reductase